MEPDKQQANDQDEQSREPLVAQPNHPSNEIAPIYSKITGLLGETDEMQPLLTSTHGIILALNQRTIVIKNLLDTTLDGLEELFALLQELQDQRVVKTRTTPIPNAKLQDPHRLARAESKIRPD